MIPDHITIHVTDAMIARYRSRSDLDARQWQSEHIRSYVIALSTQLTIACMAGWDDTATDICATLARHEPLEEVREHDYSGYILWIAYNWHCARLPDVAQTAVDAALERWPGDERLLRMQSQLRAIMATADRAGRSRAKCKR